jgi:hypothetical protein
MVFAAAQFLLQGYPAGNFRTEPAVDPNDDGQHGTQQQHGRQAVEQQVGPEGRVINDIANPVLLDLVNFAGAEVGEHFIQNANQQFVLSRHAHCQLVAIGRFATDIQAVELELAQAPDAGGEVADDGVHLIGGQGLQRRADIGHRHQVQVGMVGAQQFVGGIVLHHGDLQAIQVLEGAGLGTAFMGENDDGEVEVRPGECEEALALRGGHDARQQVELVVPRLLQQCAPVGRFYQLDLDAQAFLEQPHIVSGQALIATFFIAIFKRRPRGINAQAQLWVVRQPAMLFICESQRASRRGPGQQRQQ